MKYFKYFESQEGGMEELDYTFQENEQEFNFGISGWMYVDEKYGCDKEDKQLVEWAKTCEIGEFFNHRMGTCVRIKTL